MKRLTIILIQLAFVISVVLLFLHLQSTQEFLYYYREQQQILQLDFGQMMQQVAEIGGLGTLLSMLTIQFFVHPYVGAVVTAVLSGLTALAFWKFLRRISYQQCLIPLAFVPVLLLNALLNVSDIFYSSLWALLIMSFSLWGYSMISGARPELRTVVGIAASLLMFVLFGSIALVFATCALLYDVLARSGKSYLSISYPVFVLLAGFIAVSRGWVANYSVAFWLGSYAPYYVKPNVGMSMSVLSVPVCMLLVWACGFVRIKNMAAGYAVFFLLAFGVAGIYLSQSNRYKVKDYYTFMELVHYIDTRQWDKITTANVNPNQPLFMNCVNLSLALQGRLLNDMFKYPQQGVQSLISNLGAFTEENVLFTHMYYLMGVTSQALKLAFGTEVGVKNGSPIIMQMLIKTRLAYGEYAVAEKYLRILSKTYAYKDWAREYSKFLYNDEAVMADPELGTLRRNLPKPSTEFVSMRGVPYDLLKVLEANPENVMARDYLIAYMLLEKNYDRIKLFVETFYGTPVMTELPDRLQEAVVSYSQHDMDYCLAHGVSQETVNRFQDFRQKVLQARHTPNGNVKAAARQYAGTFWYYILN